MSIRKLLIVSLVLLTAASQALAGDDTVRLRPSGAAKGTISSMTSTEVTVDMTAGQKKQIPVNEIEAISYDGEPAELKLARSEVSNGNFEGALKSLDKIDPAKANRAEIKQDLQYYRAYCHARLALAGSGDVPKAGSEMRTFVKENPTNYHLLVAAETLGDLFAAIGRPELAFEQYAAVERAPWPEYKMRGGVAKGRILVAQKKYPEALNAFDAVLKLATEDKGQAASLRLAAQLGKATCLAATGQPDPAIAAVQAVIDNADPEDTELNARAYLTLGNCYRQKDSATKDALLAYLHVDLLYPGNREAHAEALANLARLWNDLGKPERALQATQLLKERYASSVWAKQ